MTYIPPALTPMFLNGRWSRALLCQREKAILRKNAILTGKFKVGAVLENGEWDPYWDKVPRFQVTKAYKGHGYDNRLKERVTHIQKLLAENPGKIAARKEERRKGKDIHPMEALLKKYKQL